VIVIGAGPVGLCSHSPCAGGVSVCLIEQLSDDNFLDQIPRAGTNHPATLEMFDRIGLYERLEPRGIIARSFIIGIAARPSSSRNSITLFSRTTRAFPTSSNASASRSSKKRWNLARAHPNIELRMSTTSRLHAGRRRRHR